MQDEESVSVASRNHHRFENVVVDLLNVRVTVDGEIRPLEPKSFRLLQFLIENRDRVVSKQEIFDAVWAGTFVTDNALTRAVAQIRKALGDDSKDSKYIETIPTVGYRFVATVKGVPHDEPAPAPISSSAPPPPMPRPAAPRTAGRNLVVAAVAALIVGAVGIWMYRSSSRSATDSTSPETLKPVQFSSSAGLDMGASF